jgi:hypothetical protein
MRSCIQSDTTLCRKQHPSVIRRSRFTRITWEARTLSRMFESSQQLPELPATNFAHVHDARSLLLLMHHFPVDAQLVVVPEGQAAPVTLVGSDLEVDGPEVSAQSRRGGECLAARIARAVCSNWNWGVTLQVTASLLGLFLPTSSPHFHLFW